MQAVEIDKESNSPLHIGQLQSALFDPAVLVEACIDEDFRRLTANLHSARHLLDVVVAQLGYQLSPGLPFPPEAYVEYHGNIPNDQRATALHHINEIMGQLVAITEE